MLPVPWYHIVTCHDNYELTVTMYIVYNTYINYTVYVVNHTVTEATVWLIKYCSNAVSWPGLNGMN